MQPIITLFAIVDIIVAAKSAQGAIWVAVIASIAGWSAGGVIVCIIVVVVGRAWCKKRSIAKPRISMQSQASAGTKQVTSADHDDFLNISGDVIDVNKTGFREELSYEDNWAKVVI